MTTTHSTPTRSSAEKVKTFPKNFNRFAYAAFTLMGILYWILGSDKSLAISQMGIALVFDPFNPDQTFGQRPLYQKGWLIVHLGLVLAGVIWEVFL